MAKSEPASAEEAQAEPTQTPVDYENESLEQLEARFRDGEGIIVERDDSVEPEPPATEPEPEATEEAKAEPAAEAEVTQEAEAQQPEQTDASALEELRLQLEIERAARERSELFGGRAASELGELRKQVAMLEQARTQPPPPPAEELDPYREVPQQAPQPGLPPHAGVGDLQAKVASLEQQDRQRALVTDVEAFRQKHFPNESGGVDEEAYTAFTTASAESIKSQIAPYQHLNLDTESARKLLNISLNIALAEYQLAQRKKAATEKTAQQVPEKRKAKQAATVSGSGASPAPAPRTKRPEDMTAEEADAALIKEFGDGHYRRSRQ